MLVSCLLNDQNGEGVNTTYTINLFYWIISFNTIVLFEYKYNRMIRKANYFSFVTRLLRAWNLIVMVKYFSPAVGETDLIRELSNLTSDYNLQSAEVSVSTDRNLDWISW